MKDLVCVVLAAGLGTRMRSRIPKVLHRLNGTPMIAWVIRTLKELKPDRLVVIANKDNAQPIREVVGDDVEIAIQKRPLGTAHALLSAESLLKQHQGDILVCNGDTPLLTAKTLRSLIRKHRRRGNDLSLLSFKPDEPTGYGRIIRDSSGRAVGIKEEVDLTEEEKGISEVNAGVYVIGSRVFPLLKRIKKHPDKGEYFLTDILSLSSKRGYRVDVFNLGEPVEYLGINSKKELLEVQRLARVRKVQELIEQDVQLMDEQRVYVSMESNIGAGSLLYPDVYIEGSTVIGCNCIIYPNVRIVNCRIGDNVVIRENSTLEDAVVDSGVSIGPFARLRPGAEIEEGARIGNFVEIKKSRVGSGSKILHLSYIGDADVGRRVNIGAGTITCNYDGIQKHRTTIEDDVFVGSDTQLVAPVRLKKGAYIGAGSTITKDVPEDALALTRAEQKVIKGWVKKKFKKRRG